MKKIAVFLMAMFLVLSLSSCGVSKKAKGKILESERAHDLANEMESAYNQRKGDPFKGWISIEYESKEKEKEKDGSYEITEVKVKGKIFESSEFENVKAVIEYEEKISSYDADTTKRSVSTKKAKLVCMDGQNYVITKTKQTTSSDYGKSKEKEVERIRSDADSISIPGIDASVSSKSSVLDSMLLDLVYLLNYKDVHKSGNTYSYEKRDGEELMVMSMVVNNNFKVKKITVYEKENKTYSNQTTYEYVSKAIIKRSTGRIIIKPSQSSFKKTY